MPNFDRKWNQNIVVTDEIATMTLTHMETGQLVTTIFNNHHIPIVEPYSWMPHTPKMNIESRMGDKHILLHRWLMNASSGVQVDHINRLRTDNRDVNLRLVTNRVNCHNRSNHDIELGPCMHHIKSNNSYLIQVRFGSRRIYSPSIRSLEVATVVRDAFLVIARDVDAGLRLPPSREELVELTNRIKAAADA